MTARGLVLFLALLAAPAYADGPVQSVPVADPVTGPRAYLTGPMASQVGHEFTLDPRGSSGNSLQIRVSRGPEAVKVLPLYTADRVLARGVVTPSKPGSYEFVIIAGGDPVPPDTSPQWEFGFWTVTVTSDVPTPVPVPTPGPAPTPTPGPGPIPPPPTPVPPTPQPGPIPDSVTLYAVPVFSGGTNSAEEIAFADVRDEMAVWQPELAAMKIKWLPMDRADPRLATWSGTPFLTDPAAGPTLLILDESKHVYDANGRVLPLETAKSFPAPLSTAEMMVLFKRLRGKH